MNKILFRSIPNRIGHDTTRFYRNSVFWKISKGLVHKILWKLEHFFLDHIFYVMSLWVSRIEWDFISLDSEPNQTRYDPILPKLGFLKNFEGVNIQDFVKSRTCFLLDIFFHIMSLWVSRIELDFISLDSEPNQSRYDLILRKLEFFEKFQKG